MKRLFWMVKTAMDVASVVGIIIGLCSLDSESLWIPIVGVLISTAWISFRLWKSEKTRKEIVG